MSLPIQSSPGTCCDFLDKTRYGVPFFPFCSSTFVTLLTFLFNILRLKKFAWENSVLFAAAVQTLL